MDRLMIAMIATNDLHDLPPSKRPCLIRASLAGWLMLPHGHVDTVDITSGSTVENDSADCLQAPGHAGEQVTEH